MATYSFRLIEDGQAIQENELELADETEALRIAEGLALNFDVELSDGRRFLASIHKKGNAPRAGVNLG